MCHPDFAVLTVSWELALRADGYADNTVKAYQNAVRRLAADGVDAMLKRRVWRPTLQICIRMRCATLGRTLSPEV